MEIICDINGVVAIGFTWWEILTFQHYKMMEIYMEETALNLKYQGYNYKEK